MDEFDIVDMVYTHVANANVGMPIFKDRSSTGVEENHIVISGMEYHEFDWRNVLPVNVNIFIKLYENGMTNRTAMKAAKKNIRKELLKIKPENGEYQSIELSGSARITGAKEGFDCMNIKVIINTQKKIEDYG